MGQAMAGLRGSSQAVLEGSLQLSSSTRFNVGGGSRICLSKTRFVVRVQVLGEAETGRRAVVGLVAAGIASGSFVKAVMAAAKSIKVGPPPPPSGGLSGTLNSDEPRDLDLPLKSRFYLQPLTPTEASQRAKESAKDIINVKPLIGKKAWPYVQNDLRLKAGYLRYDLNSIIAAKPKDEKKSLKELTGKLFATINNVEKYYAETVSALYDVLTKLG